VAAIFLVLVTVAFFGLSWFTTQTMLTPDAQSSVDGEDGAVVVEKGEPSISIVVSMVIGLVALTILGVHIPSQLSQLLDHAASELASPRK
jgi:hypothetical protein